MKVPSKTLCRNNSLFVLAHTFCIIRRVGQRRWVGQREVGGTEGGGWAHLQSAVHMEAASFDFKRAMVGTGWAKSCPGCMNRLRKHYSHLVGS